MDNCEKDNLFYFIQIIVEFFNLGKEYFFMFFRYEILWGKNRCIKFVNGKVVFQLVLENILFEFN